MWIFLILVVVLMVRLARSHAPAAVMRRGSRLLLVIVAQGAIGYTQYELGIPPWLVVLHIAGATAVLGCTVWFHLGLSTPTGDLATGDTITGTASTDPSTDRSMGDDSAADAVGSSA